MDRIAPGTLLAGRYRLQEQVQADPVTALWRAEDLTLERPVGVRVLSATHARVQGTLDAARRAALVDDPRLQRVLGVGVEAGSGYVVLEWVTGQDAGALAGRVSEQEAVRIVTDASEALRTAATRSLHHGRIGPRQLVRASDGSVRVVGTAIDVAASGQATPAAAARPEARDVRDLAAVLYALVTGRWPFGFVEGLLAAPTDKGRPVPARQLRADVSEPLEALLAATLAGDGPDTLDSLVQRLHDSSAASEPAGAPVAPTDAGSDHGRADDTDREPDDTDVITPVSASLAAAAVAAAGAGAAGAGAAGAGAAGAGAGATGAGATGVLPSAPAPAPAPTAPVAGAGRAAVHPGGSGRGYPGQSGQTPFVGQEDDGWDLLPVGGQAPDDGYLEGGYDPRAWDDQAPVWDEPQPWDEPTWQDGPAQGEAVATPVLPGGRRPPRRRPAGAGTGVAVVLVMGAFVVGGLVWALDRFSDPAPVAAPVPVVTQTVTPSPSSPESATPESASPEPSAPEPSQEAALLSPAGVQALDPQGDGEENNEDAPRSIDGDPGSAWTTQRYNSQDFGGLKDGLGLVFDLGEPREVSQVLVDAPGSGGQFEIRTASGPGFDGSTVIATGQPGGGTSELEPETPVTTQFVLVWFTSLPDNDGEWRGVVSEVQVQVQ